MNNIQSIRKNHLREKIKSKKLKQKQTLRKKKELTHTMDE